MSIIDRSSLEASPLADLHAIASELAIDGYRRLRRAELISAILEQQGGEADGGAGETAAAGEAAATDATPDDGAEAEPSATPDDSAEAEPPATPDDSAEASPEEDSADEDSGVDRSPARRRRGRRGGRGRAASRGEEGEPATAPEAKGADEARPAAEPEPPEDEPMVEGVVELLAGGSGFVRVDPPDPSDDDVYISSAQVKRCELVSGDRVTGPKRAPRRSERFASLIRIETINGRPASEQADSARFDDLLAAFPAERLKIDSEDPTLKAIEWLTPFGKGSRVTIVGPTRSGKSEALRRLAHALADHDDLTLTVVLAGVRPEEIPDWSDGPITPVAAVSLAAPEDAQNAAIEPAIDQARRLAARGAHTAVLIDGLDGCNPGIARKALAAARNVVDGGSLTVIATAAAPLGGETTVIALDARLAGAGRFPALDIIASGTLRPERLVGEPGAEAIARAHAEAYGSDDSS
jgi:transcription termination factor Rho